MKIAKTTAQGIIVTSILALLLGSGAVYAVSTRGYYSSNNFNAPSPLAQNGSTSTTSSQSSGHSETEHGGEQGAATHTSTGGAQSGEEDDDQKETCVSTSTSTSAGTSTSTTTTSSLTKNEAEECDQPNHQVRQEHELKFKIVPTSADAQGKGEANIQIQGTTLRVDVEIEHAKSSTTYSVVFLSLPGSTTTSSGTTTFSTTTFSTSTTTTSTTAGCGTSIGTFVTSEKGNGHAELETTLQPGNYQLGLVLCSQDKPLLLTDPTTEPATITQSTSTSESQSEDQKGDSVQEVKENGNDQKDIKSATDNKEIPAVVQVTGSSASVTQVDPKFSVSVGKTAGNGLIVSISGDNVTGSRVLLINLTGGSYTTDLSNSLKVTFDGNKITQASSLSQILNASPSDPARFIVLLTSTGAQLLVSIPHFSSHVIQVFSGVAGAGSLLALNAPILIGAILVGTLLSGVVYAKRRSVRPIF